MRAKFTNKLMGKGPDFYRDKDGFCMLSTFERSKHSCQFDCFDDNFDHPYVKTLYNVCSAHRGIFSTSRGVQYIGGIS